MKYGTATVTSLRRIGSLAFLFFLASCGGAAPFAVLDLSDRERLAATLQMALEQNKTGQSANWHNPGTGRRGTVVPIRTYKGLDASDCREFQQTATVGGETDIAYGSACRTAEGAWRIVDPPSSYHRRYAEPYDPFDYHYGNRGIYGYPYHYRRYRRY